MHCVAHAAHLIPHILRLAACAVKQTPRGPLRIGCTACAAELSKHSLHHVACTACQTLRCRPYSLHL
eukprot:5883179-Pyramimonas_sp.AAC.1